MVPHGLKQATTDPDIIRHWWNRQPSANIGLVTGKASDTVVLDEDPRNGGNLDDYLRANDLTLPANAPVQRTGSGGKHVLFRRPQGDRVPNGKLADGIDIKGDNGYIVAAPSIHPNGTPYQWLVALKGHMPEAPPWLNTDSGKRKRKAAPKAGEKIAQGGRNKFLFSEASRMRRIGLGSEAIEAALQRLNEKHCEPPLSPDEVERIAQSASQYEAKEQVGDWHRKLIFKQKGAPKAILANAVTALTSAPEWAGSLRFDTFKQVLVTCKPTPICETPIERWTDQHTRLTTTWLQHAGIDVGIQMTFDAALSVGHANNFNPVQDYLNSLKWDGVRRLERWPRTISAVSRKGVLRKEIIREHFSEHGPPAQNIPA